MSAQVGNRKKTGPEFIPTVNDETVIIGTEGYRIEISKSDLFDAFEKAKGRQEYCLKLMDKVYTKAELRMRNYHGGDTQVGTGEQQHTVVKIKLRDELRFTAIMAQTVKDFGEFKSSDEITKLRNAVNGKCRKS